MTPARSALETAVLNAIQHGFPVSADPYGDLAREVGSTREEVHAVIGALRRSGVIRRIGGSFAARPLGYVSVLVAARVQPDLLEAVAGCVNRFPGVTHNYERSGAYNLWFTVIAEGDERLRDILDEIRGYPGVDAVYPLPATRTFKIRVDFKFGGGETDA